MTSLGLLTHMVFYMLGANVTQPEKSPTTMEIEPGPPGSKSSRHSKALKASSYSKAV
ncbi:hypothetical protein DPMN_173093 [Dreissena polymorpha]|uniref:Uncharacterized protein n=1 Tax=Dreissena polymorpha TaxID=45954 RepID=A0A9D4E218_DREPO|nr:hypothetical protein DPMN_173093 [Dreissena polymorpha]